MGWIYFFLMLICLSAASEIDQIKKKNDELENRIDELESKANSDVEVDPIDFV